MNRKQMVENRIKISKKMGWDIDEYIKKSARSQTHQEIARGERIKDNFCWWCLCDNKKIFIHHEDYINNIVVFLCGKCHWSAHNEELSGPNWHLFRWANRTKRPIR